MPSAQILQRSVSAGPESAGTLRAPPRLDGGDLRPRFETARTRELQLAQDIARIRSGERRDASERAFLDFAPAV